MASLQHVAGTPARAPAAAQRGGAQRLGRFTVSTCDLVGACEAAAAAAGSQDVGLQGGGMGADAATSDGSGAACSAEQPVDQTPETIRIEPESLSKLQDIIEAQQTLFTKSWEEMKEQVYQALLQNGGNLGGHERDGLPTVPNQVTRPTTPTSNYSTSSIRTPPYTGTASSSEHQHLVSAYTMNHPPAVTPPSTGATLRHRNDVSAYAGNLLPPSLHGPSNARENTLRMWSHLGSTLQNVVRQNLQLEEDNRHLQKQLQRLNDMVFDARRAAAAAGGGGYSGCGGCGGCGGGGGYSGVDSSHGASSIYEAGSVGSCAGGGAGGSAGARPSSAGGVSAGGGSAGSCGFDDVAAGRKSVSSSTPSPSSPAGPLSASDVEALASGLALQNAAAAVGYNSAVASAYVSLEAAAPGVVATTPTTVGEPPCVRAAQRQASATTTAPVSTASGRFVISTGEQAPSLQHTVPFNAPPSA